MVTAEENLAGDKCGGKGARRGFCECIVETDGHFLQQEAELRQWRVGKAPARWLTLPTSCVG